MTACLDLAFWKAGTLCLLQPHQAINDVNTEAHLSQGKSQRGKLPLN